MRARFLPPLAFGLLLSGGAALSGCDAVGAGEDAAFTARFALAPGSAASVQSGPAARSAREAALVIEGTNGRLEITDLRLVVDKLKFERAGGSCEGVDEDGDAERDCEEVEAAPFFLDLPLDGSAVDVGAGRLSAGLYEEFEFEVKDVDLEDEADEDDDREAAEYRALAEAVRASFPAWPGGASAVVVGSFTPVGEAARPFTAYVDAEVEVEMEFEPPVEVGEGSAGSFTVEIDPTAWFLSASGEVLDLSAYDATSGGGLLELEVKLKDGFRSLKVDRDEDDDGDDD